MLRFIPLVLAAALFSLGAAAAPETARSPPPPAAGATLVPALDLLPLKKALSTLAGEGAIQSQSTFHMTGSHQGISFTFREDAVITARRPGRFRAELSQFAADGAPQKRLVVISNGAKVWTYRPGTRQYSVTTYQAFEDASNDVTALGLTVGGFYLGDGHQMAQGFRSITAGNSAAIQAALTGMGITLTRRIASVAGHDDYIYRMDLTRQGLTYQFYVDSATNVLQRVALTGTQNGVKIAFREDIKQITLLPTTARETFQYTPPPGFTKTTDVSVDPF